MAIQHPLSITATAARTTTEAETLESRTVKPTGGARRRAIYSRQGGNVMSPAQARRYVKKNAKNGYIPRAK